MASLAFGDVTTSYLKMENELLAHSDVADEMSKNLVKLQECRKEKKKDKQRLRQCSEEKKKQSVWA